MKNIKRKEPFACYSAFYDGETCPICFDTFVETPFTSEVSNAVLSLQLVNPIPQDVIADKIEKGIWKQADLDALE